MLAFYHALTFDLSKLLTQRYSTSFSLGIRLLHPKLRPDIYAIYGFVRLADEIVDSFHDYNKIQLLNQFEADTIQAITAKISLNPILHAFQATVNKHHIDLKLVHQFLHSMRMDLQPVTYNRELYEEYILGSAEVVGLMCLHVFCQGNQEMYTELKPGAMKLGAAFQKVNFLRDLKADDVGLGRKYFPQLKDTPINAPIKEQIESEIKADFKAARQAIMQLPQSSKLGVYTAYCYYCALLNKIQGTQPNVLMEKRIRISNMYKLFLLVMAKLKLNLNLVES